MAIVKINDTKATETLFDGWEETLIWSCLQGIMGEVYVCEGKETSAMAILGDFCFFAGEPDRELVMYKPESCRQDFIIMIPQNEQWAMLIEEYYKERARKVTRYAFKKEAEVFEPEKLEQAAANLPTGYTMKMMDEDSFCRCRKGIWCGDLVSQYAGQN